MKLSQLLATRQIINRHANLANTAFAYVTLKRLADRVALAGLQGKVRLRQADTAEEIYWASLQALTGSQAVIEEHFDDEDVMDLADAVAYALEGDFTAIEFSLESMEGRFVEPLRALLESAGVALDLEQFPSAGESMAQFERDDP